MAKALLISLSNIQVITGIDKNVPASLIRPHLITAQDTYIKDLLSEDLYDELSDAVFINDLTEEQTTLLEKLQYTLAWYAFFEASDFIFLRSSNKGFNQKTSDNSNAATDEQYLFLKAKIKNKAESEAEIVRKWLVKNSSLYPNFKSFKVTAYTNDAFFIPPNRRLGNMSAEEYLKPIIGRNDK
jgi:hypothetical protein